MRKAILMGVSQTLFAFGLSVSWADATEVESADPAVRLHVISHPTLDVEDMDLARRTVSALLESVGIRNDWRDCSTADCSVASSASLTVSVLLLPLMKLTDATVCAEVTRDAATLVPTVLVYVPHLASQVQIIRRGSSGRSHPALATLQIGHLVGTAIAHEVGHALGVGHGASGVMKPRLTTDDVLALRRSELLFGPVEGARMRSVLSHLPDRVIAVTR